MFESGIQMWVTLMLWTSASLWSGSFCIASDNVNPGVKPDPGDSYDQLVAVFFDNYKPEKFSSANSSEVLVENIFKSIENYQESSNSSTRTNNTKSECEENTRVVILEKLINSIFTSIKNYKENTKNAKDTINNTPQHSKENTVVNHNQSNSENIPVSANCTCVVYYKCNDSIDADAILVSRYTEHECEDYLQVCCHDIVELEEVTTSKILTTLPNVSYLPTAETTTSKHQHLKCGQSPVLTNGAETKDDRAGYGEFPWMVWIGDSSHTYLCGGSLIHPKVVLTAAHCVNGKENLLIRVGEWNTQSQTKEELFPHQEVKVKDIVVHEKFNNGSLANDPALLILETAVELSERVGLICLTDNQKVVDVLWMDGLWCVASGWGNQLKSNESEVDNTVLKRVGPLPIVPRGDCLDSLRKTKLGEHFKLHDTFICAGGNPGIDTCKGDGGSPLVCPSIFDSSVYVQIGIVAWGISCGSDTPGVYVNVPYFVPWIRDELKIKGIKYDI